MTEQLTTTNSVEGDGRGIDRRKFLLRTTAVTAGAWAAPSILTIDKAFGESHGSPVDCPCADNGSAAYWVNGYMVIPALGINETRKQGCLNDDHLQEGAGISPIGSFTAVEADCGCGARANLTHLEVDFPSDDFVTADALQSEATCTCGADGSSTATGSSLVYAVAVNGTTLASNSAPATHSFGPLTVHLNQVNTYTEAGKTFTEFTALHVLYNDGTNEIDLKFASSRVSCG